MDAKQCDRCGKFYHVFQDANLRPEYAMKKIYSVETQHANHNAAKIYDLCVDCTIELMEFLKNKHGGEE